MAVAMMLVAASSLFATPASFETFETFSDGMVIDSLPGGTTVRNAIAMAAFVSLNEAEFPPRSGVIVAADVTGPMEITFGSPIFGFSGHFTYLFPLTLTGLNAVGTPIVSASSRYTANLLLSGDVGSQPNEWISLTSAEGNISRVVVAGHLLGSSFTMDDVTVHPSPVPEPGSLSLISAAVVGLSVIAIRRRQKPRPC